jgi:ABC-type transport system substrate-binding protein
MPRRQLRGAAVVALVACVACNADHRTATIDARRTLTVSVAGRIVSFDLADTREYYSANFAFLLHDGLTSVDAAGIVAPALARRWTSSDNNRRFRFHLRTDVRFHDGAPFRAADVVRAWTAALRNPPTSARHPVMLDEIIGAATYWERPDSISGIRIIDDSTLDLALVRPNAGLPVALSAPQTFVAGPSHSAAHPIGTGPWRWVRGAPSSDTIVLVRHERRWNATPVFDSLALRVISDTTLIAEFAAGAVDCTSDMTRASLLALAARTDAQLTRLGPPGLVRLVFNMRDRHLADVRVRRALGHALDRERLAVQSAVGPVLLANGPLPPMTIGGDSLRRGLPYDPVAARRTLRDLGVTTRATPLSLRVPELGSVPVIPSNFGALLRSYWNAVGVDVVQQVDGTTRRPDIDLRVSYPETYDPDSYMYSRFHSSVAGTGGNGGAFRDALVDRWLDSGRIERDSMRRATLMRKTSARIDSLAANIFIWYAPVTVASHVRVRNCVTNVAAPTYIQTEPATARSLRTP